MTARPRGFAGIVVPLIIFGLALAAGIASVAINAAESRHTVEVLTDPGARAEDLASLSDQQLKNARNELSNSAQLLSAFTDLGTAPLPSGESTAEVAGQAAADAITGRAIPAAVDYMSDPSSSWNRNGVAGRPAEGTAPTGGVPPSGGGGGTGDGGASGDAGCSGTAVCRFDGSYSGTMSGSCSGAGQVTIPMSLSIAAGVITVTAPQPGTGTVRSDGSAAITLTDPSAVSGSASFPGGFTTGAGGGATGSGTWTEVGVNVTCGGIWNVTRQ